MGLKTLLENRSFNWKIRTALQSGEIVRPDDGNPAHGTLLALAGEAAGECGLKPPRTLIVPVSRSDALSGFASYPDCNVITIPETAASYLTPRETKAFLIHEYGHLKNTELERAATAALMDYAAEQEETQSISARLSRPEDVQRLLADNTRRDRLSAACDASEKGADDLVVRLGYGPDMVSGLVKMHLLDQGMDPSIPVTEALIGQLDQSIEQWKSKDPFAGTHHSSETFVQRLEHLRGKPSALAQGR